MNFNLMLLTVDKNVSKLIKIPNDYFAETDKHAWWEEYRDHKL